MSRSVAAIAFLMLATQPARPAEPPTDKTYVVLGDGSLTCGEFTAHSEAQMEITQWALGYITGINARADKQNRLVGHSLHDSTTAEEWMRTYCSGHPLDHILQAAEKLRDDFILHEAPGVPRSN